MIPEGAKKFEKKTEGVPDASKKGPGELPRPKMRPAKSRDGLQKGPWDPRGAPEATQDRKVSNFLNKIVGFESKTKGLVIKWPPAGGSRGLKCVTVVKLIFERK